MPSKKVKNYCRNCCKSTNHDILAENQESHRDEYQCDIIFQIVQCRGCETKSFRKVFVDIEAAYPTYEDHWEVPEDITIYPKAVEQGIEDIHIMALNQNSISSFSSAEGWPTLRGLYWRVLVFFTVVTCNKPGFRPTAA